MKLHHTYWSCFSNNKAIDIASKKLEMLLEIFIVINLQERLLGNNLLEVVEHQGLMIKRDLIQFSRWYLQEQQKKYLKVN